MPQVTKTDVQSSAKAMIVRQIDTPEWKDKGYVYIKRLPARDAQEIQELCAARVQDKMTESEALAQWCVLGACDKQGKRVFGQADIKWILDGPFGPMYRVAIATMEANGITRGEGGASKKASRQSGGSPSD